MTYIMPKYLKSLIKGALCFLLIAAASFPFSFSIGSWYVSTVTWIVTFITVLYLSKNKPAIVILPLGLSTALILDLLIWIVFFSRIYIWNILEEAFFITFVISFILGMSPYCLNLFFFKSNKRFRKIAFHTTWILSLVTLILSILLYIGKVHFWAPFFDSHILAGILHGITTGGFFSLFILDVLFPSVSIFEILTEYIKVMWLPFAAFLIGYFLILLVFGGVYAFYEHVQPNSFSGHNIPWEFGEFLYYSFTVITTIGNADLKPMTYLAKWLSMAELMIGIIWGTIILASAMGYAQRAFKQLNKENASKEDKILQEEKNI